MALPRSSYVIKSSPWLSLPGHRNLSGRSGHTATLVGRKIFILGGRDGSTFLNDLWEFDTETEKWKLHQKHVPFPARAYHTATLVNGNQLWVIGGSDRSQMFEDVHVLNTDSLVWSSQVVKGALPRGTHAAVVHPVHEKDILVHGGFGGIETQWLNDLAVFHTGTLEWEQLHPVGAVPRGRGYHTFTASGNNVVLLGGKSEIGIFPALESMYVYNSVTNRWIVPKIRGVLPEPRSNHASTLLKHNSVAMHGGRRGSERMSDTYIMEILPPEQASSCDYCFAWYQVITKQDKRKYRVKGRGGKSANAGIHKSFNHVEPGGRSAHSLVTLDASLYLFGGYGGHEILPNHTSSGSFPNEEKQPGGWRSTKRPRHMPSSNVPFDVHPPKDIYADDDLQVFEKEPREVLATIIDKAPAKTACEKYCYEELYSLQQAFESLKSEIKEKAILESELQASKRLLEQDTTRLQLQVDEGAEKLIAQVKEVEGMRHDVECLHRLLKDKEMKVLDMDCNLRISEQKVEELSKSVEDLSNSYSKMSNEHNTYRLRVESLQIQLETQNLSAQQALQVHESEVAHYLKEIVERKEKADQLSTKLGFAEASRRFLEKDLERLTRESALVCAKIDGLSEEKEMLKSENNLLSGQKSQLMAAKDAVEANLEDAKKELHAAQIVIKSNEAEIGRVTERADRANDHIRTLRETLVENREALITQKAENERLRLLLKEIEDFESTQAQIMQRHVEKLLSTRLASPFSVAFINGDK